MTLVRFQLELFPVLSSTKHQLSLQPGTIREGFPGGTVMKNPPANAGDARDVSSIPGSGRSPGGGQEGMATHPSVLAWRILWTEEPLGLQFIGLDMMEAT